MITRGQYVRHMGTVCRIYSMWIIPAGYPDAGRVKCSAADLSHGCVSTVHDVVESFEPMPYAGKEIPLLQGRSISLAR